MHCHTLVDDFLSPGMLVHQGIGNWKGKSFVHVAPNHWLLVSQELLAMEGAEGPIQRIGDQLYVMRCALEPVETHEWQLVPENANTQGDALINAHLMNHRVLRLGDTTKSVDSSLSVMGLDFWCHPWISQRITQRGEGKDALKLPHEEYGVLMRMRSEPNSRLYVRVTFYDSHTSRPLGLQAHGPVFEYTNCELRYQRLEVLRRR